MTEREAGRENLFGSEKVTVIRLAAALVLFLLGLIFQDTGVLRLALFLASFLISGADVIVEAFEGLIHGRVFDEDFLMVIASAAAFIIGEYSEAAALMLLFRTGELLEDRAEDGSRRSLERLMELRPDTVELMENGEPRTVPAAQVSVGDLILLRPGERLGLDARVVSGSSTVDMSAVTGESLPREAAPGDEVPAGSVNVTGAVTLEVTAPFERSTVSRILDMVEKASEKKTRTERFITRFARVYTPAVLALAVLTAFLPPLLFHEELGAWVYRALVILIASCPCAIVISVPLAYFMTVGGATKRGILFKGSAVIDAMCSPSCFVFDKTGTLTTGKFTVSSVIPASMDAESVLSLAGAAERFSAHPLAAAIAEAGAPFDGEVTQVRDVPGRGVTALVGGVRVQCGSAAFMREAGVSVTPGKDGAAEVFVAADGVLAGSVVLADSVKPVEAVLARLRELGAKKLFMISGDREEPVRAVSEALGLDGYYANCLPGDKTRHLETLLREKTGTLVYVGDGVNDMPVLTLADVGVSMGGLGSDSAIESSDAVIMDDDLAKLPEAVALSRRARRIIRQNIAAALAFKAAVIVLGILGIAPIWLAVAADVGVTLLAILNAARAGGRIK